MGSEGKKTPTHFRFFDNREKYLMFVTTCSEKWAIAERVGLEFQDIAPTPPALRVFDAGTGDGTVLARVMRQLHREFPTVPFLVVAKEISLEDVRLSLEKMPDRLAEHPQLVVVMTNMYYYEAAGLWPRSPDGGSRLNWCELALAGQSAHEFDDQIRALQPKLAEWWDVRTSQKTGNPLYVNPSVLVIYRADHRFALDTVIPRKGNAEGLYDLVIAAQPYRARMPVETKVKYVLEPLTKALAPGGRMVVIQSTGQDPGMDIIRKVWPDEDPFKTPRRVLLRALREELGSTGEDLEYLPYDDDRALFRFELHVMPTEVSEHIGTSTLLAAWNAATYVAQIGGGRLAEAMTRSDYMDATREVVGRHGGLWFLDESFVVARKREPGP
ncbi:MAG: hypothetical protein ACE5Q3_01875 [Alphaproteobacteria bacterium]